MSEITELCARELLETVPVVMRFIRDGVRRCHPGGPSLPQFRTLTFLDRMQAASLSDVANHLGVSVPATSRLVEGMVASGFLARRPVPTNRRQMALTLTSRGRSKLERVRTEIRSQLAAALKRVPSAGRRTVRDALTLLREAFGDANVGKKRERHP